MSDYHRRLEGPRWQRARRECFERDGWRCVSCGRAGRLECHHRTALEKGGAPYALDNLETRCKDCHIEEHRQPLTKDERDWRAFVKALERG